MSHSDLLIRAVYRFHFYYQVRRILSELQVPLPNDPNFNPFNNVLDMNAFERLCNEFNISQRWTFTQHLDAHSGLGTLYYNSGRKYDRPYYPPITSFTPTHTTQVWLGSIEQSHPSAWTTFIIDKGQGFMQAGVERLNDSIRTYVYCVLGSQAQTKTNILGTSTSFDAQKQLLAILQDVINSPVDLPSSIQRYQDILKYARSKLDYVVGIKLYMIPSDLRLQIGTIVNYNNEILIASESQKLGLNENINSSPTQTLISPPVMHPILNKKIQPSTAPTDPPSDTYESQKTAMVVGLISLGLVVLHFFK